MKPWRSGARLSPARKMMAVLVFAYLSRDAYALGSMSSVAISYGEKGSVFCGLRSDGSHLPYCYGSDRALVHATPVRLRFLGLTAGSGFVCGLLIDVNRVPYCWGTNEYVPMSVSLSVAEGSEYVQISAGDNHVCGLRNRSLVDCWGYNMTESFQFDGRIQTISSGSVFSCGLFALNRSVFCWGDEAALNLIGSIPRGLMFRKIAAGGYHVCGILAGVYSRVFCWGAFDIGVNSQLDTAVIPLDPMVSITGGKFHACGITKYDGRVVCWGLRLGDDSPPRGVKFHQIAAGDYFTCGILSVPYLSSVCWGVDGPSSLPLPANPGLCKFTPCPHGYFEFNNASAPCNPPGSHICLPCSSACPEEMYQVSECGLSSDRECGYNCSRCSSNECIANCSNAASPPVDNDGKQVWSSQLQIIIAEVSSAVFLVCALSLWTVLYIRYKLRNCKCSIKSTSTEKGSCVKESRNDHDQHCVDEVTIRKARMFTYEELDRATGGFKEESIVGKGSFSCVFKGVLSDGTKVAVKKAVVSRSVTNYNEFHTELDMLSRLNHAHLLTLLGYCEEHCEKLLVYEFMANGSLYEHLHDQTKGLKEQLDWIRRVTIAVQAARGIEYLHGYACPPVIHRDIKSSNILIDEEHNARVADFGLSLLGPTNSSSPLDELPAGTLGYLDPEYYRLHYLTTKSDVYSFGVLLLEILSGRKAIDMKYEERNIVEWAVPLIKAGEIGAILDDVLPHPSDIEALKRIANVASRCVRMRGKDRPSMDQVTTALEQALAMLMGGPGNVQPILPSEVILGSRRLHSKPSQMSGNQSAWVTDGLDADDQRIDLRVSSWITFPSITSSQRRLSGSESDLAKNLDARNVVHGNCAGEESRLVVEEIVPASP